MNYCTMCGDGFPDVVELAAHNDRHRSRELVGLPISQAFRRAFNREPTAQELLDCGEDFDKLFQAASTTLS